MSTRRTPWAAIVVTAVIAAAAALPGPAGATARNDKYAGAIDLPADGLSPPPSLELTVKSKSKKQGSKKLAPKLVSRLKTHNVFMTCATGEKVGPADNNSETDITFGSEFPQVKIKHRKFSAADPAGAEFGTGITLTGTVPKNGPATGTFRLQQDLSHSSAPELGQCDTGTVSWSAEKQ